LVVMQLSGGTETENRIRLTSEKEIGEVILNDSAIEFSGDHTKYDLKLSLQNGKNTLILKYKSS
jgi:hypothetical protein